jgi:hypothetical protein
MDGDLQGLVPALPPIALLELPEANEEPMWLKRAVSGANSWFFAAERTGEPDPLTVRHAEPEVRRSVSLLSHPTQLRFSGFHRSLSGFRPPEGGVEDRPDMNGPTQQEKPEYAGQDEHDDGREEPALEKLAQSRYEEATERGDDIPSRSLSSHVVSCRFRMNTRRRRASGEEPWLATQPGICSRRC